jgi:hypothetical protein
LNPIREVGVEKFETDGWARQHNTQQEATGTEYNEMVIFMPVFKEERSWSYTILHMSISISKEWGHFTMNAQTSVIWVTVRVFLTTS